MNRDDLCHVQIAHVPLLDDRDRRRLVAFIPDVAHQLDGKRDQWGQAIWVLGPVRPNDGER